MGQSLASGSRLGRYEISSKLGAGGMGDVYLAEDTKLKRTVALKVLPQDLAKDEGRMGRFVQEARTASSLSHPNVAHIYEIEEVEGTHFIAMEFVEGDTLRQRVVEMNLELTEALDIAIQIATALSAAHEAGVVHRDIKPENIIVRRDSYIKILDFGIAKLTERSLATDLEATTAMIHTLPGTVMGTVGYMSPEQARGQAVDIRTDIWSLGVVIYEMITGHLPFQGSTNSDVIASILQKDPPPLTRYSREVPEALEWIVTKALTKQREERYQTAREMLADLRRVRQKLTTQDEVEPSVGENVRVNTNSDRYTIGKTMQIGTVDQTVPLDLVSASIQSKKYKIAIAAAFLGLVVLASVVAVLNYNSDESNQAVPAAPSTMKITRLTTGGKIGAATVLGVTAITPDGRYIVFVTAEQGKQSLWVRQLSTNNLLQIVPPVQGYYTGNVFSPDGELVYFSRVDEENLLGALYQVSVLGGTVRRLVSHIDGPITFSPDGRRIAFVRNDRHQGESSVMLANADGSAEKKLATRKYPEAYSTGGISWSPDGSLIACGALTSSGKKSATVVGLSADSGSERSLTSQTWADVRHVIWLGDGTGLVLTGTQEWSSAGTQLWLLPYPQGEVRRITNDLNGYGGVSLGISADSSTIVTIQEDISAQIKVAALSDGFSRVRQISGGKYDGTNGLAWAPDGKLVSVNLTGDHIDIWTMNADGSSPHQLTFDDSIKSNPSVSFDGRYILSASNRSGQWNIWRMDADGNNLKQLTDIGPDDSPVCTPDGKWVVFLSGRSGTKTIWKVPLEGGAATQITERLAESFAISPDGKLIAFASFDEQQQKNQPELVIVPFEGGSPKILQLPSSANLSGGLAWMADGQSITYLDQLNQAGNIWNVSVNDGRTKRLTSFESELIFSFAWSRDAKLLAISQGTVSNDIVMIKDFR